MNLYHFQGSNQFPVLLAEVFWQADCRLDSKEQNLEGEDLHGVRLKFSKSDKFFSDCPRNSNSTSM